MDLRQAIQRAVEILPTIMHSQTVKKSSARLVDGFVTANTKRTSKLHEQNELQVGWNIWWIV